MSFVTIRILEGHSPERKAEIARRVTAAVSEVAEVPAEAVWVVFEDVSQDDWHVAGIPVRAQRSGAAPARQPGG